MQNKGERKKKDEKIGEEKNLKREWRNLKRDLRELREKGGDFRERKRTILNGE